MKKTILLAVALLTFSGCPSQEPPEETSSPQPVSTASASPEGSVTGALQPDVQFSKEVYYPGEEIEVMAVATGVSDSAWVGIVPSSVPHGKEADNDSNDLGYVYLRDKRLILAAPRQPGDYDVRLNDNDDDGKEIASRSFKVEEDPAPVTEAQILWQSTEPLAPGTQVEVPFEAPLTFDNNAWIGIVPSDVAHGDEAASDGANKGYQYLSGRCRGKVLLTLPEQPGKYDLRMFSSDNEGEEVSFISFEIPAK